MKKGFLLYNDLYDSIEGLSYEDKGQIFDAILRYSNGKKLQEMSSVAKTAFNFIKQTLDRDSQRYEDICTKNRENIEKRWNNKKDTTVYDRIRHDTKHTNIDIDNKYRYRNNKETNKESLDTDNAKKYLTKWNEVFGTQYTATRQIVKPLNEWLKDHSLENILEAIGNIKNDSYWKNENVEPIWLLRFKDPKGEPIDRIEKFFNTKPVIKYQTHL